MREKPVNPKTVERYIDFLNGVFDNQWPYECQVTITAIAMGDGVSKSAPTELVKMGIIQKDNPKRWIWTSNERPGKELALKLLDKLLHRNKKTIHVPLQPDFNGITASMQTVAERLAQIAVQNERILKRVKNEDVAIASEFDLFKIDDQRLYLAGQIATGLYSSNSTDGMELKSINAQIVQTTDDLLLQLRNNQK